MSKKIKQETKIFHVRVDTGDLSNTKRDLLMSKINKVANKVLGSHGKVLTTGCNVEIIRVV